MSTLLYGTIRGPVAPDEANVRNTVTTVQMDAPSSVQEDSPDFNEWQSDPVTEGGLTGHQLASKVTAPVKSVPVISNDADPELFGRVNNTISSSGNAASLEAQGVRGHGTLNLVEGIEPVIRDGNQFSDQYFSAGDKVIQETAGSYMTPANAADPQTRSESQAAATSAARDAARASMYSAYYKSVVG